MIITGRMRPICLAAITRPLADRNGTLECREGYNLRHVLLFDALYKAFCRNPSNSLQQFAVCSTRAVLLGVFC